MGHDLRFDRIDIGSRHCQDVAIYIRTFHGEIQRCSGRLYQDVRSSSTVAGTDYCR